MIDKVYQPQDVEKKWVEAWKKAGLAHAKAAGDPRNRFVIVIPPPNVTGALHIGHALNNTLQDALIRHHKLHGRETCWVPGTDHGGIATQNVMEKQLKAKGQRRQDVGRAEFLALMQTWTRDCKKTIMGQLERLGCLLDMGREAFTMDETRAASVLAAFKSFWDEGLIHRDARMVNWCVRCGTALSDIEVEFEERKGHLWHIRYPAADGGPGLVVATTRPETMLGDTAVAVNPNDERYRALVGKKLRLPLREGASNGEIPVVADPHVDASFGTGAVKVTPAHDPNDFEIWTRHKTEMSGPLQVIDFQGHMAPAAGVHFTGLVREKAREAVVAALEAVGCLEKTEDYKHSVGVCYRCQQPIEPLVSAQWFMKMGPLAAKALAASEKGEFRIQPETWDVPYRNWLKNIRDWCLSRQIWWGHRIPVWYCVGCHGDKVVAFMPAKEKGGESLGAEGPLSAHLKAGLSLSEIEAHATAVQIRLSGEDLKTPGVRVQADRPGSCAKCGGSQWLQDPDVLDTWFSSALWPLSVFGWPAKTADLNFFYPTSTLVTGYEILYLWVARMQMMGLHFEGKAPFRDAVIHGIVRDKSGKKMSKSLGNVVDPLTMMDKYGTDAFRFSLAMQAYPGRDIPYAEDSLRGPRNFANKLWNSTRFVLMNLPEVPQGSYRLEDLDRSKLELSDRWILSEFQALCGRVESEMGDYAFAAASDAVYEFLWDKFCDWYVELAKARLLAAPAGEETPDVRAVRTVLVGVLSGTLKLLHPVMPFITEELWGALKPYSGEKADFLLQSGAPRPEGWTDAEAEARMAFVMDAVKALRALRSQLNVPPALKIVAHHAAKDAAEERLLLEHAAYLRQLARIEALAPAAGRPPQSATAAVSGVTFYVPLAGVIDFEKERKRLAKEVERLSNDVKQCEDRLADPVFAGRAPEAEVQKLRKRRQEASAEHAALLDTLRNLDG
ncbi:MAG: valine--tRNA ligase [Elusimicrobiota bacterium]